MFDYYKWKLLILNVKMFDLRLDMFESKIGNV